MCKCAPAYSISEYLIFFYIFRCLERSFLLWIISMTWTVPTAILWCATCAKNSMSIHVYWTVITRSVPAACAEGLWTADWLALFVGKNLLNLIIDHLILTIHTVPYINYCSGVERAHSVRTDLNANITPMTYMHLKKIVFIDLNGQIHCLVSSMVPGASVGEMTC